MDDDLIFRRVAIAHAISGLTREIDGEKWIRVSEVRESIMGLSPEQTDPEWRKEHYKAAYNQGFVDGCKMHEKEQKTGKWIFLRAGGSVESTAVNLYPICSECGFEHYVTNYCPNCGAKMDNWTIATAMTKKGDNDV